MRIDYTEDFRGYNNFMPQNVKLPDQVRAVARVRHLSHRTEDTYHNFKKPHILFDNRQHQLGCKGIILLTLESSGRAASR